MTILTIGTFDLFHYGHVRLLKRCAELGRTVVAVNTDEFVEQFKGRRPVIPFGARCEVVAACRYVERVVTNIGGADAKPIIEVIDPSIIAVGSDWAARDYYSQLDVTHEWLANRGTVVSFLPYTDSISSSEIRGAL